MSKYKPDQVYEDFWKEIICDADGNINIEQLKKELYDFYIMIENVPKVYCEVTGGILSKPCWDAETVLTYFRDKFANKAGAVDYLKYDWDAVTEDCATNEEYKNAIFEYLEIDREGN